MAGISRLSLAMDINGTRMASFLGLNMSLLRLQKALKVDWQLRQNHTALTDVQFMQMLEIEAIGAINQETIVRVQSEILMNRAYRPLLHIREERTLESCSLRVIDAPQVAKQAKRKLPRKRKFRADFTALGQNIWDRAENEAKRRHTVRGAHLNDRDLRITLLDPRTKNATHLSPGNVDKAKLLLRTAYVKYCVQHDVYKQRMANDEIAVAQGVAMSTSSPQAPVSEAATIGPLPTTNPMVADLVDDDSDSDLEFKVGVSSVAQAQQPEAAEMSWQSSRVNLHTLEWDQKVQQAWLAFNLDWKGNFDKLQSSPKENKDMDLIKDLWDVDMAQFYRKLDGAGKYSMLPHMALAETGSTLSASYVERVNSAGKKVMPKGRSILGDDICEMTVMLRMNEKFFLRFEEQHQAKLVELVASFCMDDDLRKMLQT